MASFSIDSRMVGDGYPCFIIAEVGVNHNNNLETAKKMIDAAAKAGVDAVKFQLLTADGLYIKDAGSVVTDTGMNVDAYKIWKDVEMPISWIPELREYCNKRKVIFFSSVFEDKGIDELQPYVDVYKIASSELTHIPLLTKAARTGKPVIVSVGAGIMNEVDEAVKTVKNAGGSISLLYCVQKYPTPLEMANVTAVQTLKKRFPDVVIGYSDHSLQPDPAIVPVAAVAYGARIIEKHFTLSRQMEGIDQKMSMEPNEFRDMVTRIREAERKLSAGEKIHIDDAVRGNGILEKTQANEKVRAFVHRSIFASTAIKKGETFTQQNLLVVRPGNRDVKEGLHPRDYFSILGKKATCNIQEKAIIKKGYFT